ncbi:MAG: FlgD immunoglobulin-like domain containing protein [candidate division FCPU426 bacterium]
MSGRSVLHTILTGIALAGMLLSVGALPAWSDPQNPKTYYSGSNARSIALDTYRNRLYLIRNTTPNIRVFTLDSQGDTTLAVNDFTMGTNSLAISLDARRNRMYLAQNTIGAGQEVQVVTLDPNGDPSGNLGRDTSSSYAQALALDPQRNRLYVGLADNTVGLAVVSLNSSGDAIGHTTHLTNNRVNALTLDAARNKLYLGYNNGAVGTCNLDAFGDVAAINNTRTAGSGNVTSLALNSFLNCLYVAAGNNVLYTFPLESEASADPGELAGSANSFIVTGIPICLLADATRQRLYFGMAETGTSDLRWVSLDASGIPTGSVTSATADDLWGMAMDAERRKFYTVADATSRYYDLSELGMPFLMINHGASTTTQTDVELHWSLPNPHFALVDGTSDLVNYQFPVTFTANTVFDQWHSTDDERWCNVAGARATTLTVKAQLTGGAGLKRVRVWFMEDAAAVNGGAVSHYREALITLSGDTPTYTPTFSHTPTISATPTHTGTPTATCTRTASLTPSPTPTPSITGTATDTATRTPTWTPSATFTPTPSATFTPTPSATFTPTPTTTFTSTPSATGTFTGTSTSSQTPTPSSSATPSRTPTLTSTPTPTGTFTGTATISPTSTDTPVVSPTPTLTVTLTATITPTRTITPTITMTPTQTPTLPPTATPTPATLFYLDKNQFMPSRERLNLKVGLLSGQTADIRIYTLSGRLLRSWQVPPLPGGYLRLEWDGRNQSGEPVASGIYFVVFEAPDYKVVRKVLVIR